MIKSDIDFCFFSGTGNTAVCVSAMAAVFRQGDVVVRTRPIEDTDPAVLPPGGILGLACPAAAFTAHPLVWRFFRNLPPSGGRSAFLLVTMSRATLGLAGPLRQHLKHLGYKVLGARQILMPSNFLKRRANPGRDADLVRRGIEKSESFARDLMQGTASWGRVPLLSDLACLLLANDRPFSFLRKRLPFEVDRSVCTRCGLCADHCPVRNITMRDFPQHLDRCELCMRCQGICPVNAVSIGGRKYVQRQTTARPWEA